MRENRLFGLFLLSIWVSAAIASVIRPTVSKAKPACGKYMWPCKNGQCIEELRKCDGFKECDDGSDEECEGAYCDEETHYYCQSGECISRELMCDGAVDCADEGDEEHCQGERNCPKTKFRCGNGRCIPLSWQCDSRRDCNDGSDERNCTFSCPEGYALCDEENCLPKYVFCDGNEDCPGGEDEKHCVEGTGDKCTADHGFFLCKDGLKCIKMSLLCDGSSDCVDKSDEKGKCAEKCVNSKLKCQHQCKSTPDGPKCFCPKGYELGSDEKACKDIDECQLEDEVCDHFCKNFPGNFSCSCAADYRLSIDGATCRTDDPALLFFTTGNSVKEKLLDNSASSFVWHDIESWNKGDSKATGVAYDPKEDNVYWVSNDNKILFKQRRRTGDPRVFIDKGFDTAENLAIDWFARNLYATDYKQGSILACSMETTSCLPILKNLSRPRALQLDLDKRHIYWTSLESNWGTIERANLDGSFKKVIIKEGLAIPNGIAIDYPASRIYWADAKLDHIGSSNLHGGDKKILPNKDASHAYSLALWQDRIYWTEWQVDLRTEIHSCRKRDGKYWKAEYKEETKPVSNLAIYHHGLFQKATNPCDNLRAKCSDLCFPTSSRSYKCACPEESELGPDQHKCRENNQMPLVVMESKLYSILIRKYGKSKPEIKGLLNHDADVADIDYNPVKEEIVFADTINEAISAKSTSGGGSSYYLIRNIEQPISVAVDWLRENFYWINGYHRTVEVAKLSGKDRLPVINYLRNPTDLALDVSEGHIYVSDAGYSPSITKCHLNGKDCMTIVHTDLEHPSSISLDSTVSPKRIYWTDMKKNTIESADISGNNRTTDFVRLKKPVKIYVNDKSIMWIEMRSTVLHVASKYIHEDVEKINIELSNVPSDEWFMSLTMITPKPVHNSLMNRCTECERLCFSKAKRKICGCPQGLKLGEDGSSCQKVDCEPYFKKCDDGECISALVWCDGSADCSDGSDEKNCTAALTECTLEEFKCKDGQCINQELRCDGTSDCVDNSDEDPAVCKKDCPKFQDWKCESGECIPRPWRCNSQSDCRDGSDERNCDQNFCKTNERQCNDGWCVSTKWWCDGQRDCIGGEDEQNCPCKLGEYKCQNGSCLDVRRLCSGEISCGNEKLDYKCPTNIAPQPDMKKVCQINYIPCNLNSEHCIPLEAWCNGTKECKAGEDEENCMKTCEEDEVKCKGENACISKSWRCDGTPDCVNGSDEDGCSLVEPTSTTTTTTQLYQKICSENEFECPDGLCIHLGKVCDGLKDCINGVDEDATCDKCKTNKGGCDHFCKKHPLKVICSCQTGYKLASDGYSCLDINECQDETICEQDCENRRGHYVCSCRSGYRIMEDGFSCKSIDGKPWTVLVLHNKNLFVLNKNLEMDSSIKANLPENVEIIWDPVDTRIIGIDKTRGIVHKKISGGWVSEDLKTKTILATSLDYRNRNVYFAKAMIYRSKRSSIDKLVGATVKVYNLDSKFQGNLFTVHGKSISSIKVFYSAREIVLCENQNKFGRISTRNMDGTNENVIVPNKIRKCESLAIDELRKRVYWIDPYLNRIESVDILGNDRRRFLSDKINDATGLGLLNRALIWFNSKQNTLVQCPINSPKDCFEVSYGANISHTVIPPVFDLAVMTPCSNTTCQHICVPHTYDVPACICADFYKKQNAECISETYSGTMWGRCSKNICNKGECINLSSGQIECRCPKGYEGRYCEVSVNKDGSNTALIIVLVLIALLVIVIGLFIYCKRNPYNLCKKSPYMSFRFTRSFELMKEEEVCDIETTATNPPTPPPKRTPPQPTVEKESLVKDFI